MQPMDDDIRDVKKEIVEIRSLVIRTNNLTAALGADLKTVAKKQRTFERRMLWNSAAAYAIFVVLMFVGLKMAYDVRSDRDQKQIARLQEEKEKLQKELEAAKPQAPAPPPNEAAISELYELYRNQNYKEVLARWERLRTEEGLTPNERAMLRDLADEARSRLSFEHFQAGLQAMHEGRWSEAEAQLREAIARDRASPYISRVQFALARVLMAEGRFEEAVTILQSLVESDLDRDMADDYHLSLADCHERMGQFDKALTLYTQFADKFENYPNRRWLSQKIRHLREITNQIQGAAGMTPPVLGSPPVVDRL